MQYRHLPFRSYYSDHKVPAGAEVEIPCNLAYLYTDTHLYVVVTPSLSIHGPRLSRAREDVVHHVLTLVNVSSEDCHRVVYLERYTHIPGEQWLQVTVRNKAPVAVVEATEAMIDKLWYELLDREMINRRQAQQFAKAWVGKPTELNG